MVRLKKFNEMYDSNEYLFHGTSTYNLRSIRKNGIKSGSYWAKKNIAEYYAIEECELSGGKPLLIKLPIELFDVNKLQIDNPTIEDPLTYTLGKSEEELYRMWRRSKKTWKSCLSIYGSVFYTGDIGIQELTDNAFILI
jgi:hypothetical protein